MLARYRVAAIRSGRRAGGPGAGALLHSLARNHALVDGNKRLALAATIAFLGINGVRLTLTNDEAYELGMAVAAGQLDEIPELGEQRLLARERFSWL
jgi:prophage maintenance system killer protein